MLTSDTLIEINHLVFLGDSLSDRGTFNKREFLGFIPVKYINEVGYSPRGRFTNGLVWGDYFCTSLIEQFEINQVRKILRLNTRADGNADVADAFLTKDMKLLAVQRENFSLNSDKHILYKGRRFARFYCEAGLTAFNYTDQFTFSPEYEGLRLFLNNLQWKRKLLIQEDEYNKIDAVEKSKTLVVEWSGANDLLTVNRNPSLIEADNAVNARIENLDLLIHQGYSHCVLINLPDLSLTPRYQARSQDEQQAVSQITNYFNEQLAAKVQQLQKKYQELGIPVKLFIFDVSTYFKEIYAESELYQLDKNKLKCAYLDSAEFKNNQKNPVDKKNHISPSEGFMFWDDIHPTMHTHSWLALQFAEQFSQIFKFTPPEEETMTFNPSNLHTINTLQSSISEQGKNSTRQSDFLRFFESQNTSSSEDGLTKVSKSVRACLTASV